MYIPVLIFLGAMSVGVLASARWLPDLADGQVGGLSFFFVCGLLGAALGLAGLHVYELVEELARTSSLSHDLDYSRGMIVANTLRLTVYEVALLTALAGVVYLLAPPSGDDEEPRAETVAEPAA